MEKKKSLSERRADLEKECTCLYCGERFRVGEIEFCCTVKSAEFEDKIFRESVGKFKECSIPVPKRVFVGWNGDPANVLAWEEDLIPSMVRGPLLYDPHKTSSDFGINDSMYDDEEEAAGEEAGEETDGRVVRKSRGRVCPRCHMTLPVGFATLKQIRIGLLGGIRSGKSTYMVVLTKYLQNMLHNLGDGKGLGTATVVQESRDYVDRIYNAGIRPNKATTDLEQDKDVLPVIIRIDPADRDYPPFFVIFQDSPGEYMNDEARNKEHLVASRVADSTDLIMVVDVNHFIQTRQQNEDTGREFGEFCDVAFDSLFVNLKDFSLLNTQMMKERLSSAQIAISKLDFWMEQDERIAAAAFGQDGHPMHVSAISERRLRTVSMQIEAVLKRIGELYESDTQRSGRRGVDPLQQMLDRLDMKREDLRTAYTAVASKLLPEHEEEYRKKGVGGVEYAYSMNVLEPLLNILACHHVLPVVRDTVTSPAKTTEEGQAQ